LFIGEKHAILYVEANKAQALCASTIAQTNVCIVMHVMAIWPYET